MKFSEISGQSATELRKKKSELVAQLFEARMKNSMGQLANPMSIRHARRDIAKVATALGALATQSSEKKVAAPVKAPARAKKVVKSAKSTKSSVIGKGK
jgi:large subunit ribosomal protein L29